ncbi:MAG: SIS domain-containing protein [Nitrososphaerota archaeon]
MNYLHIMASKPLKERREKGIEYTPAEIESQPRLWMKNFEMLKEKEEEIKQFIETNVFSKASPMVILSGAGSSAFIGVAVQNLMRQMWQIDVDAKPTTDIVTHWDSIFLKQKDNLLVSFSRSGNSPESIGAFNLANRFCGKISHVIVTCNKDGRLARLKEEYENVLMLLLSEETNDKGLAMTSSFTTMLMTAQFLSYINSLELYERIITDISEATESLFDEYSGLIKEIADYDFERAFFLGSGALYGCALESRLKLQEMTAGRVICKADTFMGVRHGPLSVIDDKTLIVYFLSSDPFVRMYELDLMEEIVAKGIGMKRIVVCDKSNSQIERCVEHAIEFDKDGKFNVPDLCRPLLDVTIGQMIGLFKSLALGLKPDNPSERGIISRVVKGVKIYDPKRFKKQN